MPVKVKCKKCSETYPTRLIQFESEEQFRMGIQNVTLIGNNEECLICHQLSSYDGVDYFWEE